MTAMTDTAGAAELVQGSSGREHFTAFLVDEGSERVVRQCLHDLVVPFTSVHRGGISKAIEYLSTNRSPQVLLVDLTGTELPATEIHRLSEVCEPHTMVVAIGERNDVGLYRDLVQAGVIDYLVKPMTRTLLHNVLQPMFQGPSEPTGTLQQKVGKVVAVLGARGGVGTTTIATNLAWYLSHRRSSRVALVDLDLVHGDGALLLDIKPAGGVREVLENPQRIDHLFLDRVMTRFGDRLFVLAAEERVDQRVNIAPKALDTLLPLLRQQFHYVVLDLPRTEVELRQAAMEQAHMRLLVTDQTIRSIRDTHRFRPLFDSPKSGQRNLLVVNRVGEQTSGAIDLQAIGKAAGLSVDARVPYHPRSVLAAANAGKVAALDSGPFGSAIEALAGEITGSSTHKPWWRFGR
jgi:pilus assembly protein CpaE